jgi:ribosome-binding protein aMBF1 (putative translation factor)
VDIALMAIELERKLLRIRRERRRRGWTQVDLAYHSGVPVSEVSRCEMGYGTYPTYAQKLADAPGLKPEELTVEVNG